MLVMPVVQVEPSSEISDGPSEQELQQCTRGEWYRGFEKFGAHRATIDGVPGFHFCVWAPNAQEVRVVGDFNGWNGEGHRMRRIEPGGCGVWVLFVPQLPIGAFYKYEIVSQDGSFFMKSDPYAVYSEVRPATASITYDLSGYKWHDGKWRRRRDRTNSYSRPMMIYEVHLNTWKRKENGDFYTYRELARELPEYVVHMGYTHIELLPLTEHPYDRSWGYQSTGYFSATSRFGTPHDLMYLVDCCHQRGVGVILDWVPGHFCKDAHGLYRFDGAPLYEYSDPQLAENEVWGTANFDLKKPEVVSFLISNALFWMDVYHLDGLRVDAVAHMLYPPDGSDGRHAVHFLQRLNEAVFREHPHALMMAEDSTDWPLVTAPAYDGGLGFNYKWNMGWMNDVLTYMQLDPIFRKGNHRLLTFSLMYAFSENFVLPFSHDEVVHGKKSLLNKMFGTYEERFAQLKLLYGYMMAHPGKKLLFMGNELAQFDEWKDQKGLDWNLLEYARHANMKGYVKRLVALYKRERALWEQDFSQDGFEWIDPDNAGQSMLSFIRRGRKASELVVVICNFTPVHYPEFVIGVPESGEYIEIFSNIDVEYEPRLPHKVGKLITVPRGWHHRSHSLALEITPYLFKVLKLKQRKRGT
jgi:1,4-alpha-glucan branching enzyme